MKDNTPFKISVKHWESIISVEKNRSDITWNEYIEMIIDISKAVGWNEQDVNKLSEVKRK